MSYPLRLGGVIMHSLSKGLFDNNSLEHLFREVAERIIPVFRIHFQRYLAKCTFNCCLCMLEHSFWAALTLRVNVIGHRSHAPLGNLKRASAAMCVHEAWIVGPQSTAFYTQLWTPTGGKPTRAHLIYVHGFGEHLGRYDDIFPKWGASGISIFAYDQRVFGKTALDDEHRSPTSSWCRSCWEDQMEDLY